MIMLAGVLAAGAPLAHAQTWKITPSVSWESTFTDNVNLAPSDQKRSDWINQISPALQFSWASAHTRAAGRVALPVLLYVRQSESNEVRPEVAVTATWEAIERFFFIDAAINVSQQFLSPFGATPNNLGNVTNNRYTAQNYTLSPYIRGRTGDGVEYELRDTSNWSNASQIETQGVGQSGFSTA